MKITTIIGARPQFIKASIVTKLLLEAGVDHKIIHTGQHYDDNMSKVFFDELGLPEPDHNLGINQLRHGAMTGLMIQEIEKTLLLNKPDIVLVYGDTNSTLAGALSAKKLGIKVAHVEAGVRSFNKNQTEEINRKLVDAIADYHFCPTKQAILNLSLEGITGQIFTGDVMYDIWGEAQGKFKDSEDIAPVKAPTPYIIATIHREENFRHLRHIIKQLNKVNKEVRIIMPKHPRYNYIGAEFDKREPIGYKNMGDLMRYCSMVITDSGGLQKEAYWYGKPCITVRDETEWIELVETEANVLCKPDRIHSTWSIMSNVLHLMDFGENFYGDGEASKKIVDLLLV